MKWPLIAHRSRQQARQSQKSSAAMKDRIVKELNYPCDNTSAATIPSSITQPSPPPHKTIFIASIELRLAIIFGCLFGLISRESGDFNVLNNELEKSGLRNEYDIVCDVLSAPTNDTTGVSQTALFNFGATGVTFAEFINLKFDQENMLIEEHSSVMVQYMNDYVIYIDEPYYVYVDRYKLDTGHENSPKDEGADHQQAALRSGSVASSHLSHAASDSYDDSYNEDDGKPGALDTSNLSGILSHVLSQSMNQTSSVGASDVQTGSSGNSSSHLNYNSAGIQLPQQNEDKITGSYLSIGDGIATNMSSSAIKPNNRSRLRKQHELHVQTSNSYSNNQPTRISQHSKNLALIWIM